MKEDKNERAADRAIARHEGEHPGCNERYWRERASQAENAAYHFFHCQQCREDAELCTVGKEYALRFGLIVKGG